MKYTSVKHLDLHSKLGPTIHFWGNSVKIGHLMDQIPPKEEREGPDVGIG